MEELGEVLEQILKWAKAAAILGMVALGFHVYDHWGTPAKTIADSDQSQRTDTERPSNAAPTVVLGETPAEAANREPQQQAAIDQAYAAPAPQPAAVQTPPDVVYTGPACATEPQNDVPVHRKHHWPRRFFGAIGHGFRAIGHGLGKVGKTVIGRR
jgi:hypothetical protein